MFGERVRVAPEIVELQEHVEGHAPRRRLPRATRSWSSRTSPWRRAWARSGVQRRVAGRSCPGEIMGVAGVDGNGQRELAEAIAGQRPARPAARCASRACPLRRMRVSQRERLGLRYVSDDRLGEGTVAPLSVGLNLVLKRIGQAPFWRRGTHPAAGSIDEHGPDTDRGLRHPHPGAGHRASGTLSGGNIQKVVLARELSFEPRVVVYNKPTYGLDITHHPGGARAHPRAAPSAGVSARWSSRPTSTSCSRCATGSRCSSAAGSPAWWRTARAPSSGWAS